MPYPVQHLLGEHPKPVYVLPGDPIQKALSLMIEHDYSQLPVVDNYDERKPIGLITSDSIVRVLNHFGVPIDKLRVSDAIAKNHASIALKTMYLIY